MIEAHDDDVSQQVEHTLHDVPHDAVISTAWMTAAHRRPSFQTGPPIESPMAAGRGLRILHASMLL